MVLVDLLDSIISGLVNGTRRQPSSISSSTINKYKYLISYDMNYLTILTNENSNTFEIIC